MYDPSGFSQCGDFPIPRPDLTNEFVIPKTIHQLYVERSQILNDCSVGRFELLAIANDTVSQIATLEADDNHWVGLGTVRC